MPSPVEIETYMRGECHIHAIASVRLHGGQFAICYDDAEIYYEDEEGTSISSVVHVWSVHPTNTGWVARDVLGDIPFTPEAMRAHIETFFPEMDAKFAYGDAWIDMQGFLNEIEDLSGNADHQPLFEITEQDIRIASALESVTAEPGSLIVVPDSAPGMSQ